MLDHNLTLQNFRLSEPQDRSIFTVDSHDGSVYINRDDQTDFELHRNLRFRVLADEDLAEHDPFLAEFSAGLLEDGLTAQVFKSLSIGTVTFDITIQLRDVPEPLQIPDANLLVQVFNDSETEFGTVAVLNRPSSEKLNYFIASGNEDDVFRINTDTGTLSLCGGDARRFDMISTHELVNTTGDIVAAGIDPDSAITPPAVPTLNLGTIDMVEVSNGVSPTDDSGDAAAKSAASSIATKSETLQPVLKAQSASKTLLSSLLALIVFVISSVVAAIAFSRAVAARKAILEETSAMNTANSLILVNMEPDPPECRPVTVTQNWVEHPEQISQLQVQLASREQLIAQLTKELHAVGQRGVKLPIAVDVSDCGENEDSRRNLTTSATIVHQPGRNDTVLQQISQTIESQTDLRSSRMTAREQLERELTDNKRSKSACNSNVVSKTDLRYESTASAAATLEESEDLRSELSDLFELQAVEKIQSPTKLTEVAADSSAAKSEQIEDESEVTHLDSVKRYLAQLLERSNDPASTEETLVDHRKSDDQYVDLDQRTTREPARKPVKSFLDSYLEAHGGELAGVIDNSLHQMPADISELPPQPVKPRTPVDVKSIRESMNSFRAVAIQSVENAVFLHDLRLAKGKVAVWTMVIAGLIAMTLLVFLANMMKVIQFSSLNWLMVTIVALALIELGLRIQSIRRHREDRSTAMLTPCSALHAVRRSDDGSTLDE